MEEWKILTVRHRVSRTRLRIGHRGSVDRLVLIAHAEARVVCPRDELAVTLLDQKLLHEPRSWLRVLPGKHSRPMALSRSSRSGGCRAAETRR